jgi:hypothetical protein
MTPLAESATVPHHASMTTRRDALRSLFTVAAACTVPGALAALVPDATHVNQKAVKPAWNVIDKPAYANWKPDFAAWDAELARMGYRT